MSSNVFSETLNPTQSIYAWSGVQRFVVDVSGGCLLLQLPGVVPRHGVHVLEREPQRLYQRVRLRHQRLVGHTAQAPHLLHGVLPHRLRRAAHRHLCPLRPVICVLYIRSSVSSTFSHLCPLHPVICVLYIRSFVSTTPGHLCPLHPVICVLYIRSSVSSTSPVICVL